MGFRKRLMSFRKRFMSSRERLASVGCAAGCGGDVKGRIGEGGESIKIPRTERRNRKERRDKGRRKNEGQ